MVVYPGGQCRGDTPPHEIETSGAAGCPAQSDIRDKEERKGCPFHRDDDLPFPARSTTLALGVLQPHDAPKGPPRYHKDYSFSLMTDDLCRAQPLLAHPTTGNFEPVPWKLLQKPPLPEVPRSRAKTNYPPVCSARIRDLSLTTSDIDGCKPQHGSGSNCEGFRRGEAVDPLCPSYKLSGSLAEQLPTPKASGRDSLNVSDIEGAQAVTLYPARTMYRCPLKNEDDFKSRKHQAALAEVRARAFGLAAPASTSEEAASPRRAACTPRLEGPQRSNRCVDPLAPQYRVPLAHDSLGASLCCTWAEEQRYLGTSIPVQSGEIGHIAGSKPNAKHCDKCEPSLSLETRDVPGAQPIRRIGAMPYSIYGPYGTRRVWNASLDTRDIEGAQADTLIRHPQVSALSGQNSARSAAEDDQMSARGRILRSCPEKI
jgi:hypothetical protein